jgi:hypothetical protein
LAFLAIEPHWAQFSDNFPLSIDELTLRNTSWANLKGETDCIADNFFKPTGKDHVVKFKKGACTIFLQIPFKIYKEATELMQEREEQQVWHITIDSLLKTNQRDHLAGQ